MKRLEINISDDTESQIRELMQEWDMSITDVVRRAIGIHVYFLRVAKSLRPREKMEIRYSKKRGLELRRG